MSLDPTTHPTPHHQHISNEIDSLSEPNSAQHASAFEQAALSAPQVHAEPTRDKGKAREVQLDDDTESPSIVRVTDPNAVGSNSNGKAGEDVDTSTSVVTATDVASLAPELLMRVFSFLDPVSLSRAAAVCRPWAIIARDDSTWRAAFAIYFSLEAAQAHRATSSVASATPALRRLTNASWRHEFQQRVDLLRQWRKSRTPTVLSTPRVDLIKKISLSKQHRLLLSSTDTYGVASRSNPWTGKVIKGYLDAEGTANGAGNGNPNVEFSPNVSTLNMSSDASHIFWGFRSGEVGMTIMSRQGTNPRGLIRSLRFTPRASHAGPVTAIAIPFASDSDGAHGPGRSPERLRQSIAGLGDVASTFVTAGFDGTVRMWSSQRSWPLWMASTSTKTPVSNPISSSTQAQSNASSAAPICALAYDAKHGIVAAGSITGKIFVWTNIDVAALLRIPAEATDPEHLRNGLLEPETIEGQAAFQRLSQSIRATTLDMPAGVSAEVAVNSIFIDASPSIGGKGVEAPSTSEDCSLLVHHSGARVLLRHRIFDDASRPAETTVLGAAVMDEITAIRPDFEPRLPKRDARSSTAQSPSTSVYASPTLAPSRLDLAGAHTGGSGLLQQAPSLVLGPTPFESYDGSGQYPERKYICVGTKAGSLFLFDWESTGTSFDELAQEEWQGHSPPRFRGEKQLLPAIGWEAHHTTITALEVTLLHIFVGTSDGTIKVFDSLAGDLIRTINDRTATRHPARMLAAGEFTATEAARFRVTQIIADNECLVASIGHQILAFRAEPVLSKRAAAAATAAASGAKSKGGRPRLSDNKYALQVELKRDLHESKAELEAENEERQAEYNKMRNRQGFELEGLSEQEALEYALMLSRDEEAATATTKARFMGGGKEGYVPGSHASSSRKKIEVPEQVVDDPELADALEQIALAESKAEAEAEQAYYHRGSEPPTSFYDAPASRPSRGSRRSSSSASSFFTKNNVASGSGGGSGRRYRMLEDSDFAASHLDDDEDGEEYFEDDSHDFDSSPYLRPSPSPSPSASPYLSGLSSPPASRAWTILSQAGTSATTPSHFSDRWGKNSKVRTVNVPRHARYAPTSPTPAEAASLASSLSASLGNPPELSLDSPKDFPLMSPTSPLDAGGHSPYFSRRGSAAASPGVNKWSRSPNLRPTGAGSPSTGQQRQSAPPASAWGGSRTPSFSFVSATAPLTAGTTGGAGRGGSLLAASLRSSTSTGANTDGEGKTDKGKSAIKPDLGRSASPSAGADEEEMDDDMRFAIQLSLAEERSRNER